MALSETVTAKSFVCSGCGTPLKIPKNSKGHVKCPSCKTECVIEGLVKNAEMAAKENINSGYPLAAAPSTLHRKLVSLLSESPIPLDVFEKGEVVREEHYCVPSYLFYCTGTASYTYEAGNMRQHKTAIDLGDRTRDEKENYMEWTQMSGTANVSEKLFTSGSRSATTQIQKLYMFHDPNKLVDFEELDFPHDVVTYDYNLPQAAAFSEYVMPYIEKLLERKAEDALKGKEARSLSMGGGSKIDRDEIVRVFLGVYRVVFKYGGKEYSVWTTGDGEKAYHEGLPVDEQRQKALQEKSEAMEREISLIAAPKTAILNILKWLCIGMAIFMGIGTCASAMGGGGSTAAVALAFFIPALAGAIIFGRLRSKKLGSYNGKKGEVEKAYQKEIDEINSQAANVVNQFRGKKKALNGIYEEVTGDASAF